MNCQNLRRKLTTIIIEAGQAPVMIKGIDAVLDPLRVGKEHLYKAEGVQFLGRFPFSSFCHLLPLIYPFLLRLFIDYSLLLLQLIFQMIKAVVADLFMSERILIPSCTAVVTTRCLVEGYHMRARVEAVL